MKNKRAPQDSVDKQAETNGLTLLLWIASAFSLGQAIFINNALYSDTSIRWLFCAAAFVLVGLLTPHLRASSLWPWLATATAVITAFQIRQISMIFPAALPERFLIWVQLAILLAVLGGIALATRAAGTILAIAIALCALGMGAAALSREHAPEVDVIVFQELASKMLLDGQNPYAYKMPDIYGPAFAHYYAPGMVKDGLVDTGFCYPPVCLLLAIPGYLLGDVRLSLLGCLVISLILMWRLRGTLALSAMVLLASWPGLLFVITHGWTDMYVVPLLALTVYAAIAWPHTWLLPVSLGLLLASKQHIFLLTPLTMMLLPGHFSWRAWWTLLWKAAVIALLVTGPFILWDPWAWWHSVIEFHLRSPFRTDSVSFTSWVYTNWHAQVSPLVGFAAFVIYSALAIWLLPRKPAFFAAAAGGAYFFFFAWNKQAFTNYYFFVSACFLIAAAAAQISEPTDPVAEHS